MKVLIIANYAKEHINKFHIPTIKKLFDKGIEVDVACCLDDNIPFCNRAYDIDISRNPFKLSVFKCIAQLRRIMVDNRYDIIHCHTLAGRVCGTIAYLTVINNKAKFVVSYHGLNYFKGSSLLSKSIMLLDCFLTRIPDFSFCNNHEDLYLIKNLYGVRNINFCPPNLNMFRFNNVYEAKRKRTQTRIKLGLKNDDIVLCYVAEITNNKNQSYLVEMLFYLKKLVNNVKLVLIGPDHGSEKLYRIINKYKLNDCVIVLGWRNDIADLLCASDIYVASSIREGFGVNLLEAIKCDLPLVVTDNRGHREIVRNDYNGYVIGLDNPIEYANKVLSMITDKNKKDIFIKNSHVLYDSLFSKNTEDIILDSYESYLRRI